MSLFSAAFAHKAFIANFLASPSMRENSIGRNLILVEILQKKVILVQKTYIGDHDGETEWEGTNAIASQIERYAGGNYRINDSSFRPLLPDILQRCLNWIDQIGT